MPNNKTLSAAPPTESQSSRRIALKQMASLLGLSCSLQSLDVLAIIATPTAAQLLTPEQLLMTGDIAELIIPTTDTPGALAVNVHGFIDQYLAQCASKNDQRIFVLGLKKIDAIAKKKFHLAFVMADKQQKIELLTWIEKTSNHFTPKDKQFFTLFKSLTLMGYYTSEIGATQELAYLAIPGSYKGNYPFAKAGKAWALN